MILIFIFLQFSTSYSVSEDWTIHVYTGTERFAGTDSSVFIRMFNSIYGYTNEYKLTHDNWLYGTKLFPFKDLFESGEHDRFRISTEKFGFVEKIHAHMAIKKHTLFSTIEMINESTIQITENKDFNLQFLSVLIKSKRQMIVKVRRDNFPVIRSDWFLDKIIVERNRDSVTFTFKCNCWLRTEQPDVTIHVLSDLHSVYKNNASIDNKIILSILVVSIVSITCFICCIQHYCRTRDYRSVQETSVIEICYPSAPPRLVEPSETVQHPLVVVQSTDEPPAYRDLFPD